MRGVKKHESTPHIIWRCLLSSEGRRLLPIRLCSQLQDLEPLSPDRFHFHHLDSKILLFPVGVDLRGGSKLRLPLLCVASRQISEGNRWNI